MRRCGRCRLSFVGTHHCPAEMENRELWTKFVELTNTLQQMKFSDLPENSATWVCNPTPPLSFEEGMRCVRIGMIPGNSKFRYKNRNIRLARPCYALPNGTACAWCGVEVTHFVFGKPCNNGEAQSQKGAHLIPKADDPTVDFTVDHIIPISAGGDNTLANFQLMCHTCNNKKGSSIIPEFGKRLTPKIGIITGDTTLSGQMIHVVLPVGENTFYCRRHWSGWKFLAIENTLTEITCTTFAECRDVLVYQTSRQITTKPMELVGLSTR